MAQKVQNKTKNDLTVAREASANRQLVFFFQRQDSANRRMARNVNDSH